MRIGQSSNRQAEDDLDPRFEALADYVNLGDRPADWEKFKQKHPHFFPENPSGISKVGFRNFTEWIYTAAYEWVKIMEGIGPEVKTSMLTPLLWYRNRLRSVWSGNDPEGLNLLILLGFEKALKGTKTTATGQLFDEWVMKTALVPGQPPLDTSFGGLPQGQPTVSTTDRIEWIFGCTLQQAVSELMQCRWRAKICPECNKYFVAEKTAQKYCSPTCFHQKKVTQSLDYYYREGKDRRDRRESGKKSKERKP
jgi:hypothetical protein